MTQPTPEPDERPARPAPERAPDDSDVGWGDWQSSDGEDERERWLREQRPPHHGG